MRESGEIENSDDSLDDLGEDARKVHQERKKTSGRTGQFVGLRLSKKVLTILLIGLVLSGGTVVALRKNIIGSLLNQYNAASITLKVKEEDKYELEGVTLEIQGQTYLTDKLGKVAPQNLTAGTHLLKISKEGYSPQEINLILKRGDNDLKIISLSKLPDKLFAVKGFVQDYVSELPVANVQATLGSKTVQTDPSGAYSFDKLPAGEIKLILSKAGYLDKEMTIKLENEDSVLAKVPLVPSGQVIFASNRDGKRALYSSLYDGSSQKQLVPTVNEGEDFYPVLSPDNKRIVFSSTRDKVKDTYGSDLLRLYLTGADGKTVKKVSDDVSSGLAPLWSANSQWVYFSAYTGPKLDTATYKVYDVVKETTIDLGEAAQGAIFSPDSTLLAYYVFNSNGTTNSYSMKTINLVNAERKTYSTREQYMNDLRFSADGKALSYEVVVDEVKRRFEVLLAAISPQDREIPTVDNQKRKYVSSPNGSFQAFIEERDGKRDLFLVDKEEKNEKRLTSLGVVTDQGNIQWDSSSTYLTFAVVREAEHALYIVSTAGGIPKKIADFYVDNRF